MRVGPENLTDKLNKFIEEMRSLSKSIFPFLTSHKDRINVYHRSCAMVRIITNKFPVVFMVHTDSKETAGIVLTDPFECSPAPYRMSLKDETKDFVKECVEEIFGWKAHDLRLGIFELPPKTRFLALVGNEEHINKIFVVEEIKGQEWMKFATKVSENILQKFLAYKNTCFGEISYTMVDDDGLHVVLKAWKDLKESHLSLASEMAKVIREGFKLKPSKFSKIPEIDGKIIATYTIPFEDFLKKDPSEILTLFERRLINGYNSFLKGAGLI